MYYIFTANKMFLATANSKLVEIALATVVMKFANTYTGFAAIANIRTL